MSNRHLIVSLPSSRGWKKTERSIEDVAPTKFLAGTTPVEGEHLSPDDDENDQPFHSGNICLVCSENGARYTCPQCHTPYCSIECFRNHTDTASSSTLDEGHAFPCSEQFFKRKVTSLMNLESLEKEEKIHRALNRYHHENFGRQDCEEPLEVYDNEIESLYELQSQLELLENGNKELTQRELAKILPPSLKAMFEKDLQTGQLQPEWVLNHWYPWWRRELVVNGNEILNDETDINDVNQSREDSSAASTTLDERLLRVPKYESFGGRKSNDEVLLCNLLDILIGTCRTLRLYHGVQNASRQVPMEAATTLISAASVLGKDTRFDTIYQVLDHHYNSTTDTFASSANSSEDGKGSHSDKLGDWHVCIEDTAAIISTPRMVGRALLEASDILKAAIKKLKLDNDDSISKREESTNDNATNLKQIRCLRKKLQFFLSWATRYTDAANLLLGGGPKDEILAWIEERKQIFSKYKSAEDSNSGKEHTIDELNFHHSGDIPIMRKFDDSNSSDEPLLVKVQSRRKIMK